VTQTAAFLKGGEKKKRKKRGKEEKKEKEITNRVTRNNNKCTLPSFFVLNIRGEKSKPCTPGGGKEKKKGREKGVLHGSLGKTFLAHFPSKQPISEGEKEKEEGKKDLPIIGKKRRLSRPTPIPSLPFCLQSRGERGRKKGKKGERKGGKERKG